MATLFQVEAGEVVYGVWAAQDAQHARDLCAQEAGYASEGDMERRLNRKSELTAFQVDFRRNFKVTA